MEVAEGRRGRLRAAVPLIPTLADGASVLHAHESTAVAEVPVPIAPEGLELDTQEEAFVARNWTQESVAEAMFNDEPEIYSKKTYTGMSEIPAKEGVERTQAGAPADRSEVVAADELVGWGQQAVGQWQQQRQRHWLQQQLQ